MSKINWGPAMTESDRARISKHSLDVISAALDASNNPTATITSGWRPPERQARIMYDNLAAGVRIGYAEPGRKVVAVYDDCARKKIDRATTLALMKDKIEELVGQGQLVSRHCVTEEQYRRVNVIDLSKSLPNPRDFVKALLKSGSLVKVLTPFASAYNDPRVILSEAEPAIHIEIKQ